MRGRVPAAARSGHRAICAAPLWSSCPAAERYRRSGAIPLIVWQLAGPPAAHVPAFARVLRHAGDVAHRNGSGLPPLRYWRARTREEKQEAWRSGLLPGVVAIPVLLIVILVVSTVVTDPPTWLIWVTTLLVFAPFGFWAELRSARKRQQRIGTGD